MAVKFFTKRKRNKRPSNVKVTWAPGAVPVQTVVTVKRVPTVTVKTVVKQENIKTVRTYGKKQEREKILYPYYLERDMTPEEARHFTAGALFVTRFKVADLGAHKIYSKTSNNMVIPLNDVGIPVPRLFCLTQLVNENEGAKDYVGMYMGMTRVTELRHGKEVTVKRHMFLVDSVNYIVLDPQCIFMPYAKKVKSENEHT